MKKHRHVLISVLLSLCLGSWISARAASEPAGLPNPSPNSATNRPTGRIDRWCSDVRKSFHDFKWTVDPCDGIHWQDGGSSHEGRPLVFAEFGDPNSQNTTLVFATVHGDEVTPLYLGVKLAIWLKEHQSELKDARVVLAPLVNPDGYFRMPRTRMNARGVDVNRNFPTRDWGALALAAWKKKFHSSPRRYPGPQPGSELETVFQEDLIKRVRPQKILSVHSPLNFLDYDGPTQVSLKSFSREYVQQCLKLRNRVKAISGGFFPGSLGNYAGQEMGIPTLTLELPSADARKAQHYWIAFNKGIRTMIEFIVPPVPEVTVQSAGR